MDLETEPIEDLEQVLEPESLDDNLDPAEAEQRTIPMERFNQVYGQVKSYKELGNVDEIKAKLDRLNTYEAKLEEYRKNQTQPQGSQPDPKADILKQAREVGIATQQEIDERFNYLIKNNMNTASKHLGSVLSKEGVNIAPELQSEVEDYLWSRMDKATQTAIMYGDMNVLESAIQNSLKSGLLSKLKNSTPPPAPVPPPKRHNTGGTPPKPSKPATSWKEADDLAYSILKGG